MITYTEYRSYALGRGNSYALGRGKWYVQCHEGFNHTRIYQMGDGVVYLAHRPYSVRLL